MAGFDAELYLRMLGERQLLSGDDRRHPRDSPLQAPAAALVAAGAIDPTRARGVINDYLAAGETRSETGYYRARYVGRGRRTGHLTRRRIAILDHELPFGDGRLRLRYVAIARGRAGAQLRFRWTSESSKPRHRRAMRAMSQGPFPWGAAAPVIVDDRERTLIVGSGSGGGNDTSWDGDLELAGGPAIDCAWLEVEGTRIDLRRPPAGCVVSIEPVAETDPIARRLWARLASSEGRFHGAPDVEPELAALAAAGAIDPTGVLAGQLRAVAEQLPGHSGRAPLAAASRRALPEPWRSLFGRVGRNDGPEVAYALDAFTARFDGVEVALRELRSEAPGFSVEFEVAPNVLQSTDVQSPPFAWWARDDRGNHYLGGPSGWGGSEENASGTMEFWPALDPRATRLEVLPTAGTTRAVIAITLGEQGRVTP